LSLKVGAFLSEDGPLSLVCRGDTSQRSLQFLVGFTLLVVLLLSGFLLGSDAGNLVLRVANEVLTLRAETLLVALDSLFNLACELSDALLLELELLGLKSLISFELNLFLSKVIKGLRVLRSEKLNLIIHLRFLC